jgi:protein phosphatase
MVRDYNQDACLELPEKGLWAVADGMGGHAVGDLASRMIVEALAEISVGKSLERSVQNARTCLQRVNHSLRKEAADRRESLIGSTVVVLLAHRRHGVCLWAGDSRMYRFRDGSLEQLSRDHSQLEELVSSGMLSREEAERQSLRNVITRAVGAEEGLELEERPLEFRDGDLFLLCSDGLTNEVTDEEIARELTRLDCEEGVDRLLSLALQRGARDNVSVLVAHAVEGTEDGRTVVNPKVWSR